MAKVLSDITIIFLTANRLPRRWVDFHRGHLLRAVEGHPLITVSVEPVDLPGTHLIQEGPFCAWSVYQNMLRAAKIADTKYVGIAEDDTLYPARHFNDFRPPDDAVAYNMSRWTVFSWKGEQAFYSCIRRHGNFSMIGPRQLVIDAIDEREAKYPNGHDFAGEIGRPDVELRLGVRRNKLVEFWSIEPVINLAHPQGLSPTYINTPGLERKTGELKSYDIPIWGRAVDIAKIYNDGVAERQCHARPQESAREAL